MLGISDFQENLVAYECVRIRDARTVWLNDASTEALAEILDTDSKATSFARHFSYVPAVNSCFTEAELDQNDRRVYFAERYGGRGVGDNGGGARAGNHGKFQIKGTGPNPLAGHASKWHSYGSLSLIDAAYEAIYSTVLDGVLPRGCAKVHGVIHTSLTGALNLLGWGTKNIELLPTSGALLVREQTMRPAHFMHAELFASREPGIVREPMRIRAVHRRLRKHFDTTNQFVQFLGEVILSSAKQFAFARAARIAHGGISPSNICLDGRWIDLSEARFLSGGKNFRGAPVSFYDEPQVIAEAVTQIMYVFGKCNTLHLNTAPLLDYFQNAFDGSFAYYTLSMLGLPSASLSDIARSAEGKVFAQAYSSVVLRGKRPVRELPGRLDPDDPVIGFMQSCYLSLTDASSNVPDLDALPAVTAFRTVFHRSVQVENGTIDLDVFRNCAIASAVKALRWAYLSAYFYRDRIRSHLANVVGDRDIPAIGAFIQECVDQAKWIFATACRGDVCILETDVVRVSFDQARAAYVVRDDGERIFRHYDDCLAWIKTCYPKLSLQGKFDPLPYLEDIAGLLSGLERMSRLSV